MPTQTINTIINQLAKEKRIEAIIENVAKGEQQFNLDDLVQDLYLDLFTKDPTKLQKMIDNDEIDYYLYRMVANNIYSVNSRYYRTYKQPQLHDDITTLNQ